MKIIRKIGAVFVVLSIILCSIILGVNAENQNSLPTTDTTLNFVTDYSNAISKSYNQNGVFRYDNGLLGNDLPNSYVSYKTLANSPVIADFKYIPIGSEKPEFYTSSDGKTWSALSMNIIDVSTQNRVYYSNGIGAQNKYIKIIICNQAIADVWRCDLMKLSFNASDDAQLTMDTTLDFYNNYAGAMSKAYKCRSDLTQVYEGGVSGTETPNTYIIYKVEKNSPIKATFKVFKDLTSGRPEFYASSDAKTWSKVDMIETQNVIDGNSLDYYVSGIGEENKYIKIIISNVALTALWHINLTSLSYCASTEPEDKPVPDTTLDFIKNGNNDLGKVFRKWNFDIAPSSGYKNAAYATKAKSNYIVLNTAYNSPFNLNVRVHDSMLAESVTVLVSSTPNEADSWKPLDATSIQPKNGGYNTWNYYSSGIGDEYNYIKISLSASSGWAFCIENVSYSKGTIIGPDTSGYEEPEEVDPLPKPDTTCDFFNSYDAALEKAYMFSADLAHIWQGGAGGTNTPESYITYKVDENSPIVATFKIFASDTDARPQFYASSDGKTWEACEMKTDVEINGTSNVRYYSEGIGKKNKYIKIVLSDKRIDVLYYIDLQNLKYNASKEPLPYDLNLSFTADSLALARVYSITPADAFEHLLNTGLILTVDYLSGQQKVKKPRMTIAIKPGTGVLVQFKVSVFADALKMFPKFYASKDGKNWDEVKDYLLFSTGSNGTYISYRATIEPLNKKYEFFSFEYPQTKDYAGIDIEELDDYVPDCLNSGIILTNISFMRSTKYVGLDMNDNQNDDSDDDTYYKDRSDDYSEDDNMTSPNTGRKDYVAVCAMMSAICMCAIVILKPKKRREKELK